MTYSTNCTDTFVAVAPDCPASKGVPPKESEKPSIALRAFRLISQHPYRFTSDDVLFTVFADREEIPERERAAARVAFFAKPKACLRASDLSKRYGWGVHYDVEGRIALYGLSSDEYATLASGEDLEGRQITVRYAMRSKRA